MGNFEKRLELLEEEPGDGKNKHIVLAHPGEKREEAVARYCAERGISRTAFNKTGSVIVRFKDYCAARKEKP